MRLKFLQLIVLIPLAALFAACGEQTPAAISQTATSQTASKPAASKPAATNAAEAPDTTTIQTLTLTKGHLTSTMTLPGQLLPFQTVDLYAKVNSFVKAMYVDVGSQVHKGQLLATLEAPELQAATDESASLLQTQEANWQASKATYDRLYKTSKIPGTVSPNELELALAKRNSDSAALAAARSHYLAAADIQSYLQVRAPFDGVISARNVYPGASAGPAGKGSSIPLMTLQQQRRLRLVVDIPEAATAYLHEKDTLRFTVQNLPGHLFVATVTRMAGALDLQLRTEQLQMDVVNDNGLLLPGMFAQVNFDLTNSDQQFIVPLSAVTANSKRIFVIRIIAGKTEWVTVQKGREADGKVEIYGDLKPGDQLVAAATDELKGGTLVKTN
ncbi:MAG TPA: efflux RND transporter periplasmic adaptor subunit [Puia sp.]|uniref:efflux RND transporter periplasmic adaptor subunit n=1 Tax=Puia sp. TaxID=2045100 RepID=UPI002CD0761D|nr:efflux RND transporter periplasmic adaptor subunit [Puia sp.]HVU98473.1 efflux RND transporter periplasmic adaptor subunit [Puia sp.]